MLQKLASLSMEGETFFMRILPKISLCYIYLFFSYTEVDPAVIAGDGVEMFKNEARMKFWCVCGI